jgi:ribose-phosphate pyrophosphokinase
MILLHTKNYKYLTKQVLVANAKYTLGEVEEKYFPDGESYHRIVTEIRGKDVAIVGGTISDSETMELFDFAVTSAQNGARSITLVIPYFGYGTMERAVHFGEMVKAKNRAILLSSIPHTQLPTKILLFDLHSEGIPFYFGTNVQTQHIYCKKLIMDACKKLYPAEFVLAATDAGRAKWVESLAAEMHCEAAFAYKQRTDGQTTNITGVNANVFDKHVIIYDDMIRTGGSLMQAADVYAKQNPKSITVICTHGLFNNNALDKIKAQGIINKVICTNSHPNAVEMQKDNLEVISIAHLIAENL